MYYIIIVDDRLIAWDENKNIENKLMVKRDGRQLVRLVLFYLLFMRNAEKIRV